MNPGGRSAQRKTVATPGRVVKSLPKAKPAAKKKRRSNRPTAAQQREKLKNDYLRQAEEDDQSDEEEELGAGETFEEYWPKKLTFGESHPDPVVETASLASVDPMAITYTLTMDKSIIENGLLSALQLESISYACQSHERFFNDGNRAGFLIGDGAGVGKGRTIAGIILENYLQGRRKAIWFSVSTDLLYDAERDLRDINAQYIPVMGMTKIPYGKIATTFPEGVIFSTYTALIGKSKADNGTYKSRLDQLIHWCGPDFDGCIVFDESHKAKNLAVVGNGKSTKTGQAVLALQEKLPSARIVYASATGASETRNMAYMVRLGLWGKGNEFDSFKDFFEAVEKRGIGIMEIVAMDMKQRGMYIARQLSFKGVTFRNEEVPVNNRLQQVYDECVDLWTEAWQKYDEAADLVGLHGKQKMAKIAQFWGAHQRFFRYLCMAAKIDRVVEIAKAAVGDGKCVVIGLQSTGEARTNSEVDKGPLEDFVSGAKAVFEALIINHFPLPEGSIRGGKRKANALPLRSKRIRQHSVDSEDINNSDWDFEPYSEESDIEEQLSLQELLEAPTTSHSGAVFAVTMQMREELLERIEAMSDKFPKNMLDDLIHKLGGSHIVAEMTGRKGRVVQDALGKVVYELRSEIDVPMEKLNLLEKERFMSGEKLIAIISEAASSGISLQSDRRVLNTRPRLHITMELPWSADRAIQQFGRTHRSNQMHPPQYVFMISDLGGERRFASTVARRLESLGALTHGDRRATETQDLSSFNLENKFGQQAVKTVMRSIALLEDSGVPFPVDYPGDFRAEVMEALKKVDLANWVEKTDKKALEPNKAHTARFLNRLMGIRVQLQNSLFAFFMDTLKATVIEAKRLGRFDFGIQDLGARGEEVSVESVQTYILKHATGMAQVMMHTVKVDRGLSWEEVVQKLSLVSDEHSGVYRSMGSIAVSLIIHAFDDVYHVYRPNTGRQNQSANPSEIRTKYYKLSPEGAETSWKQQYEFSLTRCSHMFFKGSCAKKAAGFACDNGLRKFTHTILTGSVLSVWTKVEGVLKINFLKKQPIRVLRVKTSDDLKIVGINIPRSCVMQLNSSLRLAEVSSAQEDQMPGKEDDAKGGPSWFVW